MDQCSKHQPRILRCHYFLTAVDTAASPLPVQHNGDSNGNTLDCTRRGAALSFSLRRLMRLGNIGNPKQSPAAAAESDTATFDAAATANESNDADTAGSDEDF